MHPRLAQCLRCAAGESEVAIALRIARWTLERASGLRGAGCIWDLHGEDEDEMLLMIRVIFPRTSTRFLRGTPDRIGQWSFRQSAMSAWQR